MQPHHVSMLGLVLDIIGAFFVSAEAIKLDNLRMLRERVLEPAHKATLSPKITWVDEDKMVTHASKRYVRVFMGLHYLAGLLVLLLANLATDGLVLDWFVSGTEWLFSKRWYWIVFGVVLFALYGVFAGLWLLGEAVHVSITFITRHSITLIEFVESRTPDGTVGIIGFIILLVGFVLQLIGTGLAAP